jgi:transporter family protein
LSYALYNVFIKKASSSIDPVLGGVLLQFVAAILGSVLYICKRFLSKSNATTIASQTPGIWWAVAAGAAVGAAEILSFIISGMGVQAMQSIPIIIGGSVLFGTILGKLWLQEALGIRGYVGVLLISAGIALVGMDPGTKLH